MRLSRILRRYGSEIKLVGTIIVICLLFGIYNLIESYVTKKVEGTTLSTSIHNETQERIAPTYTPYPTLVAPTTVQINIYINNTLPIYNEFTTNSVWQAVSLNPTSSISVQPTNNPTNTPIPTNILNPTITPTNLPSPTATIIPLLSTFTGKYFNNITLSGSPILTRSDSTINFDWAKLSPDPTVAVDSFSVIWEGTINSYEGTYQIITKHDDGMRIYINNNIVYNQWSSQTAWKFSTINLAAGLHTLKIEYYEGSGNALIYFDLRKL